ncbi:MAG: DUF58 domain-containing protein [Alphaproteobacteria bacterium PA2]|nr:MAG: DUF58 domain-containing protein [Alphaproteobacteria bacterium PA2]
MIYPTRRAIVLALLGAPVVLAVGLVTPGGWTLGAFWALAALALVAMDAWLAASPDKLSLALTAPGALGVGGKGGGRIAAAFARGAPSRLELAVGVNDRLSLTLPRRSVEIRDGQGEAEVQITPLRRGDGRIETLWSRWSGPLGLAWVQRRDVLDHALAVTPNIAGVRDAALRLFARDGMLGVKAQMETGEGSEFHALKEFQTGMDIRAIDWKQSARHGKLVGREYHSERNHPVILALDTGRLMCAPLQGIARIDHVINAALLMAFVSLKLGDRVGLFAFDARPRISSGPASGAAAFPLLQKLAAGIDYSTEETNFTLGLTTLAGQLNRRALVVIFTDFADPTSAQLMLENVGRLLRTHLVMFVVLRDLELEELADRQPQEADDISRAVIAGSLLQQREAVLNRLRRAGAQIVEATPDQLGPDLVNTYLDAKRRDLL